MRPLKANHTERAFAHLRGAKQGGHATVPGFPEEFAEPLRIADLTQDKEGLRDLLRLGVRWLAHSWNAGVVLNRVVQEAGRAIPSDSFSGLLRDFQNNKKVKGLLFGYGTCIEQCSQEALVSPLGGHSRATYQKWWKETFPDIARALNIICATGLDREPGSDHSGAGADFTQIERSKLVLLGPGPRYTEINRVRARVHNPSSFEINGVRHGVWALPADVVLNVEKRLPAFGVQDALTEPRFGASLSQVNGKRVAKRSIQVHQDGRQGGYPSIHLRFSLPSKDLDDLAYSYWVRLPRDPGAYEAFLTSVHGPIEGPTSLVIRVVSGYGIAGEPLFERALVYGPTVFPESGTPVAPIVVRKKDCVDYRVTLPSLIGALRARWEVRP